MTSRDERASESKVRLYLLARQLVKSSARASEFSLVLARVVLLWLISLICYLCFTRRCVYVFMYSLIDDSKITLDAGWKLELDKKPCAFGALCTYRGDCLILSIMTRD